jgi:hypothetical protein
MGNGLLSPYESMAGVGDVELCCIWRVGDQGNRGRRAKIGWAFYWVNFQEGSRPRARALAAASVRLLTWSLP